jgi:hypothetical protein
MHLGLASGWLASPSSMRWDPMSSWGASMMAVRSAADAGFILGSLLLIARRRSGLYVLRVSVCGVIALTLLGLVRSMIDVPEIRRQWSTPAAAAVQTLAYSTGFWLPLLIAALTLLPLAPSAPNRSALAKADVDS